MFYYRPARERGVSRFAWLESRHSFSFGHYHDRNHMGVGELLVINDDRVAPGAGFEPHPHRDMEIISYVIEGAIEHRDTHGNHFVVPAGDVQRMTAGSGIMHSEFNHSATEPLHFLQIWIQPNQRGLTPGYEQTSIRQTSPLTPIVTPDGREGSLHIHQDASIYRLRLQPGESWHFEGVQDLSYLHIIKGGGRTSEHTLGSGDGLGLKQEVLSIEADAAGLEALWFELGVCES